MPVVAKTLKPCPEPRSTISGWTLDKSSSEPSDIQMDMKDIQNQHDYRNIPIDKVGIKNLRYPITVRDRRDGYQHTVAMINMYVDLPHNYKGTHMSRFVEMLHLLRPEVSLKKFSAILKNMKAHLKAASAHIEMTFPYFIEKKAPVSISPGLMDYTCSIIGTSDPSERIDIVSEVVVPISSVCPCSLEISDFGAHNQRGEVRLATRFKKFIWLEDMIELVEQCASCDVYSVLKRVDEKYVTERAFSNPKFVEDIVRDVAKRLQEDDNITWFSVSAENFESIHNHSAYAQITSR
jgi:GTP cyclohydrolase I